LPIGTSVLVFMRKLTAEEAVVLAKELAAGAGGGLARHFEFPGVQHERR
jgi:hypothetical protein